MLIIRSAQLAALARAALAERLVRTLRADVPAAAGLGSEALRARIDEALERAARHELEDDRDLTTFARLTLAIGPRFDEHPAIAASLASGDVHPTERLRRLLAETPPHVWAEAALIGRGG